MTWNVANAEKKKTKNFSQKKEELALNVQKKEKLSGIKRIERSLCPVLNYGVKIILKDLNEIIRNGLRRILKRQKRGVKNGDLKINPILMNHSWNGERRIQKDSNSLLNVIGQDLKKKPYPIIAKAKSNVLVVGKKILDFCALIMFTITEKKKEKLWEVGVRSIGILKSRDFLKMVTKFFVTTATWGKERTPFVLINYQSQRILFGIK